MGSLTSVVSGGLHNSNSLMGGVLPFVNNVRRSIDLVSSLTGGGGDDYRSRIRAEQDLALQQLKDRQAMQEGQIAQNNALTRQQNALQLAQADEERRAALRRAVARQRAQFGSQGVGSNAGSSEAVLLGMFEESEDEQKRRAQLDTLRSNALDQNLKQTRSLNLLQATQLAERQRLSRLF